MNIYVALSLFSVIIVVYLIITEMFTIMFRFTGLPVERACFQVGDKLTVFGNYKTICRTFDAQESFEDQ